LSIYREITMARESYITFEQVASTADALNAAGTKISSRAIREVLGSGSMATICKYMAQWQSRQVKQTQAVDDTLDPAISRSINGYLASKVKDATAAVTTSLTDLQAEAATIIAENERQAADLETQAAELAEAARQLGEKVGRIAQLEADAARMASELNAERAATAAARIELAKAELKLEAMPKIENELQAARAELTSTLAACADLHEAAAVANANRSAAEAAVNALKEQLTEQKQAAAAALNDAKKSAELAAELRGKLAAVEAGSSKAAKPVKKAGAI
jgi:colicin import membrane protein